MCVCGGGGGGGAHSFLPIRMSVVIKSVRTHPKPRGVGGSLLFRVTTVTDIEYRRGRAISAVLCSFSGCLVGKTREKRQSKAYSMTEIASLLAVVS